jgi:hypothetical protein
VTQSPAAPIDLDTLARELSRVSCGARRVVDPWRVALGGTAIAEVTIEGGWIQWAATLPASAERPASGRVDCGAMWRLLAAQTRLPLALKYAFRQPTGAPRLQCEWPIGDEAETERRVREIGAAFRVVLDGAEVQGEAGHPEAPADLAAVAALCRDAGWDAGPVPARDDEAAHAAGGSSFRVTLGASRRSRDATVSLATDGGVRASVDLVQDAAESSPANAPLAATLGAAAGRIRFARPFVREADDRLWVIGFEVTLGREPAGRELGCALDALAAADDLAGREIAVLARTDLAARLASLASPPQVERAHFVQAVNYR